MSSISAGTTSTTTLVHSGDTTGSLVFKTNDTGSGGTTAVTIDTSQNVGIGTTTMNGLLNLYGGDVYMQNSTTGTASNDGLRIYLDTSESNSANFRLYESAAMKFFTNNTERMRMDSSGNLLVGTTSITPGYGNTNTGVQIGGNNLVSTFSRSQTDFVIVCNQNTVDGSNYYQMQFRVSNVSKGSINSTSSGTTYNTTSDYRLKENIAPMTGALAKVAQLKPVTYKWKEDGSDGEGFIAHELAEVCPQAVSGAKDAVDENGDIKPQGIDTSFLVATLTAALQETKALIDQQAETINALTARVVALESK